MHVLQPKNYNTKLTLILEALNRLNIKILILIFMFMLTMSKLVILMLGLLPILLKTSDFRSPSPSLT